MLLLISTRSRLKRNESHVLETFVRKVSRVFYYVLNPVNTPNISDKPLLMRVNETSLPKTPEKRLQ